MSLVTPFHCVSSTGSMGKRCLPIGKRDMDMGDVTWSCESQKPLVVGSADCVLSRVYFSILYEENDLFSKTEVIFLTNVVTSK